MGSAAPLLTVRHVHGACLVLLHQHVAELVAQVRQQEQGGRLAEIVRRPLHVGQPQLQIGGAGLGERIGEAGRRQVAVLRVAQPAERIEPTEYRVRVGGAGAAAGVHLAPALDALDQTRCHHDAGPVLQERLAGALQDSGVRFVEAAHRRPIRAFRARLTSVCRDTKDRLEDNMESTPRTSTYSALYARVGPRPRFLVAADASETSASICLFVLVAAFGTLTRSSWDVLWTWSESIVCSSSGVSLKRHKSNNTTRIQITTPICKCQIKTGVYSLGTRVYGEMDEVVDLAISWDTNIAI